MKTIFAAMCMLVALGFCTSTMAADDKKMKKEAPVDGSVVTITGMMAVKAKDAKSDVVCRLTSGKNKTDLMYNLVATGEVAKQIETMRAEGDKVKVTGKVTGDSIAVDKIEKVVYMKK